MDLNRSYLFVPGNRPDRFDKALASGADRVIVDLEDAVPPELKHEARRQVVAWLSRDKPIVLRINAAGTPWFLDDLAVCQRAGVAAVMLSKCEAPGELALLGSAVSSIPLIESAAGFDQLRSIASAPGVERVAFGAIDFQCDMGMAGGAEELMFFRSQIVLASRVASIGAPIDSPCVAIGAPAIVDDEARRAGRLGFAGKLCVHPEQVAIVNRAFSPTDAEIAWARRVVAASSASGGSAVQLDGTMVDKPVVLRAESILRRAGLDRAPAR